MRHAFWCPNASTGGWEGDFMQWLYIALMRVHFQLQLWHSGRFQFVNLCIHFTVSDQTQSIRFPFSSVQTISISLSISWFAYCVHVYRRAQWMWDSHFECVPLYSKLLLFISSFVALFRPKLSPSLSIKRGLHSQQPEMHLLCLLRFLPHPVVLPLSKPAPHCRCVYELQKNLRHVQL